MLGEQLEQLTDKCEYQQDKDIYSERINTVIRRLRKRSLYVRVAGVVSLISVCFLIGMAIAFLLFFEDETGKIQKIDTENLSNAITSITDNATKISEELKNKYGKVPNDQKEALQVAQIRAKRLRDELSSLDPENIRTQFFISLIATRITIVLMLLFMANFGISIFRYFSRLASFFESRADILFITDISTLDPEKVTLILSADRLDFKTIKSPDQQAIDLAKALLGRTSDDNKERKIDGDKK